MLLSFVTASFSVVDIVAVVVLVSQAIVELIILWGFFSNKTTDKWAKERRNIFYSNSLISKLTPPLNLSFTRLE